MAINDVDIDEFRLVTYQKGVQSLDLRPFITDGILEHSLDDGGWFITITVLDPDGDIRKHPIFGDPADKLLPAVDVQLDDYWFRLRSIDRAPDGALTLEFMDRIINRIARRHNPKVTSRANATRRAFIVARAREAGVERVYSPEINVKKKILSPEEQQIRDERGPDADIDASGGKDLGTFQATSYGPPWEGIQGTGVTAGGTNLKSAPKKYIVAIDPTGPMDLGKHYYIWPNPFDYKGSFLADDTGSAIKGRRIDFYDWRGRTHQNGWGMKPVRVSESPNFASTDTEGDPQIAVPYQFVVGAMQRDGKRENWWEGIRNLSDETRIKSFVDRNVFLCMSEEELAAAKAAYSIADDNTDSISWSYDDGEDEKTMEVSLKTSRWSFPPGASVVVHGEGRFDGRYIVATKTRSLFDRSASLTLRRPLEEWPEPAHETIDSASSDLEDNAIDPEFDPEDHPTISRGGPFGTGTLGPISDTVAGSPKNIIDNVILPMARAHGINKSVSQNDRDNASHGPTVNGNRSDHQGPPGVAWAADMSNGSSPTPQMDALARDLARKFDIPWNGSGLVTVTHGHYRYQLIYRTNEGGNHYNHVHFGIRKV